MASQRDVKNRISAVRNIQKITRAMEMVAAARLRRAEQRIASLRPYTEAIRRMARQVAQDAGSEVSSLPLLAARESERNVALLLVTADRGLAGAFNSQIIRAGLRLAGEHEAEGRAVTWYASGRRGVSSLEFRKREVQGGYTGFTDRPSHADAHTIATDLIEAFVEGRVDRVELLYNGYVSPLTQEVRRETLLPIAHATIAGDEGEGGGERERERGPRPLVEYEPEPEAILQRLIPDYVEVSVLRALLESTASEHGARMTAMRNASENAGELITDLTLQMNRARQAEITQEIMEVVAGAEGLS